MAKSNLPPEITSTLEATLATYDGGRYELQVHICPRRMVSVTGASAAIRVQHSYVGPWVGLGTVWKWS